MKKNNFIVLAVILLTGIISNATFSQTNIALDAELATSYVSDWENLGAIIDNYQPTDSRDKGSGAYGNWNGTENYGNWNWVELTFQSYSHVDSVRVYWWDDNDSETDGIQFPSEAYIEYWGCNEFVNAGDIGVSPDQYNTLVVDTSTFKIRINMRSAAATGILELQAFGAVGGSIGLVPYVQINNNAVEQINTANITFGDNVKLSNDLIGIEGGTWSWTGPKSFTSTDSLLTLDNVQYNQIGIYTAMYESNCGVQFKQSFTVLNSNAADIGYDWPSYTPAISYDFRDEYPALEMPTKNSQDCDPSDIGGEVSKDWWTFVYGHNRRSDISDLAVDNMLDKFNRDFAYIRDTMGWPPDKRAKDGYRSAIYLFGSGLCTDGADTNALGGWMGSINGYPMVLASYFPVRAFDPAYADGYQTEAMIHEGIHAILADMPGGKDACWFQEGGNTWLQQEMAANRERAKSSDGKLDPETVSMGGLNGTSFLAPFMPIECYSGWLQDGSFGGPCAQGVNMFDGSGQICTWRTYLGGTQYSNSFPTLLAQILGPKSIPWIWRYCEGTVLEGLADTLGDNQIRRLITEYKAKQALIDMDDWSPAIRKLLNGAMNMEVRNEWDPAWLHPEVWIASPYARTTLDKETSTLIPEYRTTPGWSGSNEIPLKVKGDSVFINFQPIGQNMKCLIAYRDILGNPVYTEPVDEGACAISLANPAANDVVFAVIVNTDYVYEGEKTRKAHFDYRLQIDTNLVTPASTHKRWYAWDENPDMDIVPDLPPISQPDTFPPTKILLDLNTVYENDPIGTEIGTFTTIDSNNVNPHSYFFRFAVGTHNNYFSITDNKLFINANLDFETIPVYKIKVRSSDAFDNYVEEVFEIEIIDQEESSIIQKRTDNVSIFPNPMEQSTTIKMVDNEMINSVKVVNLAGSTLKQFDKINESEFILNKDDLPGGLYFVQIDAKTQYCVKIVIQ